MDNDLKDRLKKLKIEDMIWIIYIVMIGLSLYSNGLERHYFIYGDDFSREQYQKMLIIIFGILLLSYSYFALDSFNDLLNLNDQDSSEKVKYTYLAFIASIFILISGIIFFYIAIHDENIEVELAFN